MFPMKISDLYERKGSMSEYNPSNLTSTLVYIKNRFGTDVFAKHGQVSALVSDLAPSLKSDRIMLERMSRIGILEEFVSACNADENTKKYLISKSMTILTHSEYIRPNIAATYLNILVSVFGWNVEVDIPRESSIEKMKFDSKRYFQESQDRDFLMGKKAFEAEKFDDARRLFSKAYRNGNALAGVHLGEIYYSRNGCDHDYDKAIPLFVDGMNRECPLGAEWLAEAYRTGKGVPKDKEKSKEIFDYCVEALEAMCASGSKDAQYVYGFDLLYGNFSTEDEQKAFYWLEKAMKNGHVAAGVQVAKIYLNGWGREKDEKKGMELLEQYSKTTNSTAHFELGKIYYYGKVRKRDYKNALKHFLTAAKKGHASSQDYVGEMYRWGQGTEKDYIEARKWYELAAEKNNKYSLYHLGAIYHLGLGIKKDYDKAFKYFQKAAELGDAFAQFILLFYYVYGLNEGKYTDYKMGFYYLEKSAEQGNRDAQRELARNYCTGQYGIHDDHKFVYWMTKSAEQGDAEAQRILGEAYIRFGDESVLPFSYPDAITWLEKAADQNDVQALTILVEVFTTVNEYKNTEKSELYLKRAEQILFDREKNGDIFATEHEKLADLYYKIYSDETNRQIAFNHYCKAFSAGERGVIYDLGFMYFINGYNSTFLSMNTEELVQIIKEEETKSDSFSLAYLLGQIYYSGYRVTESKSEAEKWYLKAKEKGSLSACCRLAFYYINEKHLYDKGFAVLEEACKHGSIEGTRLLGLCYKNGIGVKKSRSKAKALLKEAAQKGDEEAAEELKKFIF